MSSHSSLNHIYRTVWNQALGAMVAVPEIGTAGGHPRGANISAAASTVGGSFGLKALSMSLALALGGVPLHAIANPTGGVVVAGQATMASTGNNLLVTTQNAAGTNHSVINWQSFSIPQGSTTYFQQPSATSTSINRVVTNTPSQLFGTLGSNGNLVLVNQAGIAVGAGAVVDTAGFTASSLQMSDADALGGKLRFGDKSSAGGKVTVAGSVLARSGDVVLVGSNAEVGKDALVQAPNGATILVAGSALSISSRGLEGISFDVQAGANTAVNLGSLKGDAVGIFAGTLKHSGQIHAQAVKLDGGKVVLKAKDLAEVSGSVAAAANRGLGGEIQVTADKVWLKNTAVLDASAPKGEGEVLVGGGWQGKDARLTNAQVTLVSPGATIKVDATELGDAGKAVVWADGATRFDGLVSAKGGPIGGRGGKVEVSGKSYLEFRGGVDLSAVRGDSGALYLDPANLTIQASNPDINGDAGGLDLNALTLTVPYTTTSIISAGAVQTQLGLGSVVLEAENGIAINAPINYLGSGDRSLTLRSTAYGNIAGSAANITSSGSGKLDVTLSASSGGVSVGAITTNGGNFTATAGGTVTLNGAVNAGSGIVSLTTSGFGASIYQAQGANIAAGGLTVSAPSNIDLSQPGNLVSGNISLNSTGTGGYGGYVSFRNSAAASTVTKAAAYAYIDLRTTGSVVIGGVDGVTSSNSDVRIEAANGISLSASVHALGTLTLKTEGSAIAQTAGHVQATGSANIDAGTGDINLVQTLNDFNGTLELTGGVIKVEASSNLDVVTIVQTGVNKELSLKSGGGLCLPATALDTGTANITLYGNAGFETPSGGIKGKDIFLKAQSGTLYIGGTVEATGTLSLENTYGGVNDNGGVGAVKANVLQLALGSDFSLTNSSNKVNSIIGTVAYGEGVSVLTIDGARSFGAFSTSGSLEVNTQGGAISQTGAIEIGEYSSITLNSGAGDITLKNSGNLLWGLSTTSIGAVDIFSSGSVYLNSYETSTAGSFKLVATGDIDVSNSTIETTTGGVILQSEAFLNVGEGVITSAAAMSLRGGTGVNLTYASLAVNEGKNLTAGGESLLVGADIGTISTSGGFVALNGGSWRTYSQVSQYHNFAMFPDTGAAFKQYNLAFGATPSGTGNGRIFSDAPVLSGSLGGAVSKVYDGGLNIGLAGATFPVFSVDVRYSADNLSAAVLSGGSASLGTNAQNVGTAKSVTASGMTVSGITFGEGKPVFGYAVGEFTGNIGQVTPALAVASISPAGTRVYDGTNIVGATLFSLTGLVNSETLGLSGSGTMTDKNVGSNKPVTLGTLALADGTGLASNYTLNLGAALLSITPASISSVTGIKASSKTYDRTSSATVSTTDTIFGGKLVGDVLTVTGGIGTFDSKNVGTGKVVTLSGFSLGGADAGNYTLSSSSATATADITAKTISAGTFTASNKVYDGTAAASVSGGALTGAIGGDTVGLSPVTASFADKAVGTAKVVTVNGLALTGTDAGNYVLSTNSATAQADITAKALSVSAVTAANKVYDATTTATLSGGVLSGEISGDKVTLSAPTGSFASKNVGTYTIALGGMLLGGADAGNYSLGSVSTTATANITAKTLSVGTVTAANKVYDGTTTATISGGNLLGAIAGDSVSIGALSGAFLDKNVGNSKPVVLNGLVLGGADARNYSLGASSTSAVANITPLALGVSTLTAADKVYDGTTSATLLGGVLSGAVPGDSIALAPTVGSFLDKNVGVNKPVSVSGLSLSGSDAQNYTLGVTNVNATATINPKSLVVSGVSALNKTYDGKTDATIDSTKLVLNGLIAGDAVATTDLKAEFSDKNAGVAKKVLITGLGLNGADARNYTFIGETVTTADIAVRESSNWLGAAGDLWSDPKNWDVVPEGANVRSVVFPTNTSRVTLNAGAGNVTLQSFNLGGSLVVEGGSLQVAGAITTAGYAQSGGTVSTPGAFRVTGNFDQTSGNLIAASVEVTRASGDIVVGNITSPVVTLTAQSGAIRQTGAIQQAALTTKSTAGTLLPSTGNRLSSFNAENTGAGDIELVNEGVLTTSGIINTGGNIKITNTGGITSLDQGLISASSPGAKVSLKANSPLSIGAAGIAAGGDIALVATNLTSAGNITLNGPIESKAGAVVVTAANNLTQNSSVLAPLGVSAAAGGTLTLGPNATSGYQPVSYQVNSLAVTPPRSSTSSNSAADLVVALMTTASDLAVDRSGSQLESLSTKDKEKDRDLSKELIVSEGQVCRP
ncbi:MAG: hypothetical protein CFE43_07230 [Burkholderiales bacterium PBB3]|nr:MAG: hypothetical protein CFE43_07230 [Burkholderiales bacterium PBB3]